MYAYISCLDLSKTYFLVRIALSLITKSIVNIQLRNGLHDIGLKEYKGFKQFLSLNIDSDIYHKDCVVC